MHTENMGSETRYGDACLHFHYYRQYHRPSPYFLVDKRSKGLSDFVLDWGAIPVTPSAMH